MKQVVQNVRAGEIKVADIAAPALRTPGALVTVGYSVISAGTERAAVSFGTASLLGKARSRPDLVKQVVASMRTQGVPSTVRKVLARISSYQSLGYSCAGTVSALDGVEDILSIGQHVACAGTGFANHAEFVYAPRNLCVPVPLGVSAQSAAYATIGAVAMQGVRRAELGIGDNVVVIGCGLIGLLTVQLLTSSGCHVLAVDLDEHRVQLARELGARAGGIANSPEFSAALSALTRGRGADCVIITAASRTPGLIDQAVALCRDRGRIVVVGDVPVQAARGPMYMKEIDLRLSRSYGPGRYDATFEEQGIDYPIGYVRWTESRNMESFLDLVAAGRVNTEILTSHRIPVEEAERAYGLLTGALTDGPPPLGVVLEYPAARGQSTTSPSAPIILSPTPTKRSGLSVGIGVVGAGGFATGVLLPLLKDTAHVSLQSIASASGVSARTAAERLGFRTCAPSFAQILADRSVDAVVIATRHDSHADYVIAALEAGKHVFVEKPLAINWAQYHRLERALQHQPQLVVMVGYNRRFAPQYTALRKFFAGRPHPLLAQFRVDAGFIPSSNWVHDPGAGGGRLVGEGCHFIDLLMHLTASPLLSIESTGLGAGGGFRSDDNVVCTLRFADGSLATLLYTAAGSGAMGKERFEVFCGGRTALLDDYRRLVLSGRAVQVASTTQQKGHAEELQAFISACQGRSAPMSRSEILASTAATLLALDSLRLGRPLTYSDIPSAADLLENPHDV